MKTDFDIPRNVATCPHCTTGNLYLEVDEWETETGVPTEAGVHVSCDGETEQEDDPHWAQPYITLLPLEHKVWLWAKDNVRVEESEDEELARLADWNAGKPLPGGMHR